MDNNRHTYFISLYLIWASRTTQPNRFSPIKRTPFIVHTHFATWVLLYWLIHSVVCKMFFSVKRLCLTGSLASSLLTPPKKGLKFQNSFLPTRHARCHKGTRLRTRNTHKHKHATHWKPRTYKEREQKRQRKSGLRKTAKGAGIPTRVRPHWREGMIMSNSY
jgi:hypothetical protein